MWVIQSHDSIDITLPHMISHNVTWSVDVVCFLIGYIEQYTALPQLLADLSSWIQNGRITASSHESLQLDQAQNYHSRWTVIFFCECISSWFVSTVCSLTHTHTHASLHSVKQLNCFSHTNTHAHIQSTFSLNNTLSANNIAVVTEGVSSFRDKDNVATMDGLFVPEVRVYMLNMYPRHARRVLCAVSETTCSFDGRVDKALLRSAPALIGRLLSWQLATYTSH